MASLRYWYTGQLVTAGEMRAADAALEASEHLLVTDLGFGGVHEGLAVVEHPGTQNLTVNVATGLAYSPEGERIYVPGTVNVNCAFDYLGNPTSVTTPGESRYIDIYAVFDRVLSDPRLDATNNSVYFVQDEGYGFDVVQGSSAVFPAAPGVLADGVLIARILLAYGDTEILDAAIDTSTSVVGYYIHISGTPLEIVATSVVDAFQQVTDAYNGHVTGAADRHAATHIDYAGGAAWADGDTNPAATVEVQIDKMLADLASTSGAGTAKIGGAALAALYGGTAVPAGSLRAQLLNLKDAGYLEINARTTWLGGRTNAATGLFTAIDKIITDLAVTTTNDDGAERIGLQALSNWLGGRTNPASSVSAGFNKIIADLGAVAVGDDGAERIGTETGAGFSGGSVRAQLDEIHAQWGKLSRANTWTGPQTMNERTYVNGSTGAASDAKDVIASLITERTANVRHLLWDIIGADTATSGHVRLYDMPGRGLEIVINASWSALLGWSKDNTGASACKLTVNADETSIKYLPTGGGGFFDTDWDTDSLTIQRGGGDKYLGINGVMNSAGSITVRASAAGSESYALTSVNFPKVFPGTPSSTTVTVDASTNITGTPAVNSLTAYGFYLAGTITSSGSAAYFNTHVAVS